MPLLPLLSATARNVSGRPDYFHQRMPLFWRLNQELPVDWYLDLRGRCDWEGPVDSAGLPGFTDGQHTPLAGSLWALGQLQRHHISRDAAEKERFLAHARWLRAHGQAQGDAVLWSAGLPSAETGLGPERRSAAVQALAVGVLLRAARVEPEGDWPALARAALAGLQRPVAEGGCRSSYEGGPFYCRFPRPDRTHFSLIGWILALVALRDAQVLDDNEEAGAAWREGVAALARHVRNWDSGRWSYEMLDDGAGEPLLASPTVHDLHIQLIRVVYRISKDAFFDEWKERWEDQATSPRTRGRALLQRARHELKLPR